jgi:hypothetical protein
MQVVSYFRLLGRAVAKALQDCRLLDLPLSPVLYRLALYRHVDLFDIRQLDTGLGAWACGWVRLLAAVWAGLWAELWFGL